MLICLFAEDLEAVFKRLKGLLAGLRCRETEDQLSIQLPRGGQVPGLSNLLVNQGAVVLEVGTKALRLESEPDCKFKR